MVTLFGLMQFFGPRFLFKQLTLAWQDEANRTKKEFEKSEINVKEIYISLFCIPYKIIYIILVND